MSYCLNRDCPKPQNLDTDKYCNTCGSSLLLKKRYRPIKLLKKDNFTQSFVIINEELSQASLYFLKQFIFQNQDLNTQEKLRLLFEKEVLCLETLNNHPQIPQLIDYFAEENCFYLVQEYIEGKNLKAELNEQGTFSEAQIWELLENLLPVIKYIHDSQIIHRDIKPENIIRREADSHFILINFSLAKLIQKIDFINQDISIGSAEYVAPEQVQGKAVLASDLYSLGVTCIHLLTQISPFNLFDISSNNWVWQQYLIEPVSESLAQILDKLIQNSLDNRFQSADEVILILQQIKGGNYPTITVNVTHSSWQCVYTLPQEVQINCLAISPDSQILASGGEDNLIRLWHRSTKEIITTFSGHTQPIESVIFSPNNQLLASSSKDKTVKIWQRETRQEICTIIGHSQSVTSVTFSPDSEILASGSWDKTIKLWQVKTGQEYFTLTGHKLQVNTVAFSPNNQWLASSSKDRTVNLWQLSFPEIPTLYRTLKAHFWSVCAVTFSPDSQILATGSEDNTIKLWDIKTGQVIRTLSEHSWSISSLAFSADGKILVSSSWDKTIKLWQVKTGEEIANLTGHSDSITSIVISSLNSLQSLDLIVSSSKDKTIKFWQ